ncbi:MAG: proton-conducting transporter membrane subunit [Nitriliruptoraceae bacterium]
MGAGELTMPAAGASVLLWLLATSLVPAAVIFVLPERAERTRRAVNMVGAIAKVALVMVLVLGVFSGREYEWRAPFLPGIDLVLRADPVPLLFVFLSALLWLTTTIYAIGYLSADTHRSRFFGFFSLCVTASVGIALAGNLVTLLVFYELLTVTTYPLIVHQGHERARAGGRIYLLYAVTGGAAVLVGVVWLQTVAGTVAFRETALLATLLPEHRGALTAIFVLLVGGFGVKAAIVPLHVWLPHAMVAPAPVSALLHAVAVVKAGVYAIVRVIHDLYGATLAIDLGVLAPLAVAAAVTIVYGSVLALAQQDLKRRLAYSTVSQLSYIVLGVSVVGLTSVTGGVAHLVHQGVMKVTLFYCAGILATSLGVTRVDQLHGVARRQPLTMAAFTVAALGMIGVPPTVGFITKWHLGLGAVEAGQPWVIWILVASTLLNAAYFLPLIARAWLAAPDAEVAAQAVGVAYPARRHGWVRRPRLRLEADPWLLFPPVATGASVLVLGVFAGAPLSPISWAGDIARELLGRV